MSEHRQREPKHETDRALLKQERAARSPVQRRPAIQREHIPGARVGIPQNALMAEAGVASSGLATDLNRTIAELARAAHCQPPSTEELVANVYDRIDAMSDHPRTMTIPIHLHSDGPVGTNYTWTGQVAVAAVEQGQESMASRKGAVKSGNNSAASRAQNDKGSALDKSNTTTRVAGSQDQETGVEAPVDGANLKANQKNHVEASAENARESERRTESERQQSDQRGRTEDRSVEGAIPVSERNYIIVADWTISVETGGEMSTADYFNPAVWTHEGATAIAGPNGPPARSDSARLGECRVSSQRPGVQGPRLGEDDRAPQEEQ